MKMATTIQIENRVRPCIMGKHRCLFHRWADKLENQKHIVVGIIEWNDGTVHEVYPSEIRFVDDWVDTIHDSLV